MTNPFPDLPADEFDALQADIKKRGMVYPVIRDQHGGTIDGHQRERAAAVLGIVPHYQVIRVDSESERLALAIALNAYRRQLTPDERREAILRLAATGMTQADIGRAVGTSAPTVNRTLRGAEGVEGIPREIPDDLATGAYAIDRQGRPPEQRGGRPRLDAPASGPAFDRPLTVTVMMTLRRMDTGEQRTHSIGADPATVPAMLRDAAFDLTTRLLRGEPIEVEEPEDDDDYHEDGEEVDPDIDEEGA